MTVSTTLNKISYTANGATTVFSFSFAMPSASVMQVFFTDLTGAITQQFAGFTVALNPVSGSNPTAAGGTVTFSSPPTAGFLVTLYRSLPLTQSISLANQGTLYQPVEEAALDYQMMTSQQVLEVQSRALTVAVSDSSPSNLPSATARALQVLGFDASGNPIAVSTAPAGVISGAMAPVVGAATLAVGRTAFGLGTVATLGLTSGSGLLASGGNLFVVPTVVGDASSPVAVNSGFNTNIRVPSIPVTYNLPQSNTLANGFNFTIQTTGGAASITPFAGDSFNGMTAGASLVMAPGTQVNVVTNGTGTWFALGETFFGFNAPLNLQINATVAASALTIALKDRSGNDPTVTSPICFSVSAGGNNVTRVVATPLSITVPNGASLGTVNGQAGRIWIGLFDNSGTPVLGVFNALNSTGPSLLCWDESTLQTTTNISGGSTAAQTWYTNGALAAKAFRVIGYLEATEPTAGAWTVTPSKIQLYGPGQKKPGDIVQEIYKVPGGVPTTASATYVVLAAQTSTITPQSAADLIRVEGIGNVGIGQTGVNQTVTGNVQFSRGTVNNTNIIGLLSVNSLNEAGAGATIGTNVTIPLIAYDIPNTTSAQAYAIQGSVNIGTLTFQNAQITLKEIYV